MCTYSILDLCRIVKGRSLTAMMERWGGGVLVACYTFRMRPFMFSRQLNFRRAFGVKRQTRVAVLLDVFPDPRWSPGCPSNAE